MVMSVVFRQARIISVVFACLLLSVGFSFGRASATTQSIALNEASRPLTPQELQNAIAFTKAMNYIRFFHPSDEAAVADWNSLASEGMRHVEGARNPPELSEKLKSFFAPYAPTVQFLTPGETQKYLPYPAELMQTAEMYQVRWRHRGVGLSERHPWYQSKREYLSVSEETSAIWRVFYPLASGGYGGLLIAEEYNLGSGLRMSLPSVILANPDKKTIPVSETSSEAAEANSVPETPLSGDDRYVRMGNVALVWGIFQHFYPYWDFVAADWDAELAKSLSSAAIDSDGKAFAHTLYKMTAHLNDGHIIVYSDDDGEEFPPLKLVALHGKLHVQYVEEAAKEMPLGSIILAIDDEPAEQFMAKSKSERSAATETFLNDRLATFALMGLKDSTVKLSYQTPDNEKKEINLARDVDGSKYIRDYYILAGRPEAISEIQSGIWYVDLIRTNLKSFEDALPNLTSARGIIFDCRPYPSGDALTILGHLHNEYMLSANWDFPVSTEPDRRNMVWQRSRSTYAPRSPQITCRKVFLTNGGCISAAETFLGVVEFYKLGEIIGEQTAGTNGNTNGIELPGGYMIPWTGLRVIKHDGTAHHGVGIKPTISVSPTVKGIIEGRDEVLEKAIEVLTR